MLFYFCIHSFIQIQIHHSLHVCPTNKQGHRYLRVLLQSGNKHGYELVFQLVDAVFSHLFMFVDTATDPEIIRIISR